MPFVKSQIMYKFATVFLLSLGIILLLSLISCSLQNEDKPKTSSLPISTSEDSTFTEFATGAIPKRVPRKALTKSLDTKSVKPGVRSQTLSYDEKCTWTQGEGMEQVDVWSIRKLDTDTLVAGGNGLHHGVYISEDNGETWVAVPFEPPISQAGGTQVTDIEITKFGRVYATSINELLEIPNEEMLVPRVDEAHEKSKKEQKRNRDSQKAITLTGIFYSDDGGNNWSPVTSWGIWYSVLPVGASVVYMGSKLRDNDFPGSIWALNVHSGWPAVAEGDMYNMIGEVISEPQQNGIFDLYLSGTHIIATGLDRLFRMPISQAVPYSYNNIGEYPWEVRLTGENPRYLLEDNNGNLFVSSEGHGIYSSADDGNTWTSLEGLGLPENGNITQLVSPVPGILIAGVYDSGVYLSTDEGLSFALIPTDGLGNLDIRSLEINGVGAVVAGTSSGIYWYPRHCLD